MALSLRLKCALLVVIGLVLLCGLVSGQDGGTRRSRSGPQPAQPPPSPPTGITIRPQTNTDRTSPAARTVAREEENDQIDVGEAQLVAFIINESRRLGIPVPTRRPAPIVARPSRISPISPDAAEAGARKTSRHVDPMAAMDPEASRASVRGRRIEATPAQAAPVSSSRRPSTAPSTAARTSFASRLTPPSISAARRPVTPRLVTAMIETEVRSQHSDGMKHRQGNEQQATPFGRIMAEIKSHANTQTETEATTAVTQHVMPLARVFPDTPQAGRAAARGLTAGGLVQGDPAALLLSYTLDAGGVAPGRVTEVEFVANVGVANPGSLPQRIHDWCDIAYNHGYVGNAYRTIGTMQNRIGGEYQAGHLIARSFGGSNTDPLNFVPMHYLTNTYGGRWQKAEDTVAAVAGGLVAVAAAGGPAAGACPVNVRIRLNYANWPGGHPLAANTWVPSDGTYRIGVTNACYAALNGHFGVGGVAAPSPTLRRFLTAANVVVGGGNTAMTVTWRNRGDLPIPAAVANQSPNFVVDAMIG